MRKWILPLFLAVFAVFPSSVSYAQENMESVIMVAKLFKEVDPARPENSWYPPYAKENVSWLLDRLRSGELRVQLIFFGEEPPFFMSTRRQQDSFLLSIAPEKLIMLSFAARYSGLDPSEPVKDAFLLGIVHETEHLRFWPEAYSCYEQGMEEARVWMLVDEELASFMINDCRILVPEFLELHEILNGGEDDKDDKRERLREFMLGRTGCEDK